jgi:uncharacterized membrane protein
MYKALDKHEATDPEMETGSSESDQITGTPAKDRAVPIHELILSVLSINLSNKDNSRYTSTGQVYTNLNIQEPSNVEISFEQIKYVNIFAILCCWCFPITGIVSIIFAHLTKKHYNLGDLVKAKRYLKKAEWLLLLTFFFGLTLIGTFFAFMEAYWFKSHSSAPTGIFHTRSV